MFALLPALLALATPVPADPPAPTAAPVAETVEVSAAELFRMAGELDRAGKQDEAAQLLFALTGDPDLEIRTEARFRLATLRGRQERHGEAADLLQAILLEKPEAGKVRLALAQELMLAGDRRGARRELRSVNAAALPDDVARMVQRYSALLQSRKRIGGSVQAAIAPDSNINRATSQRTLETTVAPLQLDDNARARSGIGLRLQGQGYLRQPVANGTDLVLRASGDGDLYAQHQFDDISFTALAGIEYAGKVNRLRPAAGRSWRWFGGSRYARTDLATVNWIHAAGPRTQLTATATVGETTFLRNALQNGGMYQGALSLDRAFGKHAGGAISISVLRQDARDPGYATTSGGAQILGWYDLGLATVFGTAELRRLRADERLVLFGAERREWFRQLTAGGNLSAVKLGGFSPTAKLRYERNRSTVDLYDYSRVSFEFGLSKSF